MIEGLETIGVHWPSLILYMVDFAVLTLVLYLIAYRPLLRAVRRQAEDEKQANTLLSQAQEELATAHTEAQTELAAAHKDAEALIRTAMAKARADAKRHSDTELAQVRAQTESILQAEREQIIAEGTELATTAAAEVLRDSLTHETRQALVRSAIAEIKESAPSLSNAPGQLVAVTTAIALTVEEWSLVGEAVRSLVGGKPILVHHVRPEVLGGLAVELGDTIIDATVLGKLHQLKAELLHDTQRDNA